LFRPLLKKNNSPLTIGVAFFPAVVLGSVLWQSFALAFTYSRDTLRESFYTFLVTRGIQFAVTFVIDVLLVYMLCKSNVLRAAKLWKPESKKEVE
jgi:UDP-N-acetylmuramyl pentapeptide phosphotransferase/UDP-N-acetylglucosamine-1-phosphate transferase